MSQLNQLISEKGIKALILDLDGVITQTAMVHAKAWKKLFDNYLEQRGIKEGIKYQSLDIKEDYRKYIDGIPRYDGVRNFLRSRKIELPEGTPEDKSGTETITGLGNQKNIYFQEIVQEDGVDVFEDTVAWLKEQLKAGKHTAVISASKNCKPILEAAGLLDMFEVRVDGVISAELGLKGKPDPAIFLEAARQLGVSPGESAIFEDARMGVEAGKAGGFALVVGIDRENDEIALKESGADLVINRFA